MRHNVERKSDSPGVFPSLPLCYGGYRWPALFAYVRRLARRPYFYCPTRWQVVESTWAVVGGPMRSVLICSPGATDIGPNSATPTDPPALRKEHWIRASSARDVFETRVAVTCQ